MEIGKLPMAIVGITICVIVCAVVLIPVVSESTAETTTFVNKGYFTMDKVTSGDETSHTVTWSATTPNQVTLDDDTVKFDLTNSLSQVSVLFDNNWLLRANITNGSITTISYIISQGTPSDATANQSLSVTFASGTATVVIDETSYTKSYTYLYFPSNNGNYVMKKYNESAYITPESDLVCFGLSNIDTAGGGNKQLGLRAIGTMDDGMTYYVWRPESDNSKVSVTDTVFNKIAVSSHIDLYLFSDLQFILHYTNADETITDTNLTYSYIIVPLSVTVEKTVHPDVTTAQLINVIPLLVIISIVMLAVGTMIYYRR